VQSNRILLSGGTSLKVVCGSPLFYCSGTLAHGLSRSIRKVTLCGRDDMV
jgi:hypothetical protein